MIEMNEKLIQSLLPGKILSVQVGLTRTAVLAETNDGIRCGLAATLTNRDEHEGRPAVQNAGRLQTMNYIDLASLIESYSLVETSIGLATINALLPRHPNEWVDLNAEDYLAEHGAHKNVTIVGHFPFVDRLRSLTQNLWVLELNPRDGDLPAQAAPEVVPQSDVLAITATTLINKTFQGLIDLCRPDTTVILVGPSAPLSPVMYDYGIDVLFGTIVTDPQSALLGVGQGISLRQLQQEKLVRLVTLTKGK